MGNDGEYDLFGNPIEPPEYAIYHDESGLIHSDKYFFSGLVLIKKDLVQTFSDNLKGIRDKYSYQKKIHFNEFSTMFNNPQSPGTTVARDWFIIWLEKWLEEVNFYCFIVDLQKDHLKDQISDYQIYNYYTKIAIKSFLAWSLGGTKQIRLYVISDEKSRSEEDNFKMYLPQELGKMIHADKSDGNYKYKGPTINCHSPVYCPETKESAPYDKHEEILQFCDLLLGSFRSAFLDDSKTKIKQIFGTEAYRIIDELTKEPWKQTRNYHRNISVVYYPDNEGRMENDPCFQIKDRDSLFLDF